MKEKFTDSEIARKAGYSRQRVSVLRARGLSPVEIIARGKARERTPPKIGRSVAAGGESTTALLAEVLRRKAVLQADRRELDLRIERGELISIH